MERTRLFAVVALLALCVSTAWALPPRISARQARNRATLSSLDAMLASSPRLDLSISSETYQTTRAVLAELSRLPRRQLVSIAGRLGIRKSINAEAPSYLIAHSIMSLGQARLPSLAPALRQAVQELSQGKVVRHKPQAALQAAIQSAARVTELTYDSSKPAAREATLAFGRALEQLSQPQLRQVARQLGIESHINLRYYPEHLSFEIVDASRRLLGGQAAIGRLRGALEDVAQGRAVRRDPKVALQAAIRAAGSLTEVTFDASRPAAREATLAFMGTLEKLTQGQLEQLARKLGVHADVNLRASPLVLAHQITDRSRLFGQQSAPKVQQALLDLSQGKFVRSDARPALRAAARAADALTELTYDASRPAARAATLAFTRALGQLSMDQLELVTRQLGIYALVNFGSSTNAAAHSVTDVAARYFRGSAASKMRDILNDAAAAAGPFGL